MKKEDSEILSKLGKETGFKVPENYFADFADKMSKSLPEKSFVDEVQPTRWHRIRPWVYMAAMFGGIWCMMSVFTDMHSKYSDTYNPGIAEAFKNESFVDDFVMSNNFDEYQLLQDMYEDSIQLAMDLEADSIK